MRTGDMKIEGMDELDRALKDVPKKAIDAVNSEGSDIVQDLKGESQRGAPILTGDLRGSAFAEWDDLSGVVGFTMPYALRQHETHKTKSKYLENPFKEKSRMYIKAIGDAVKRAVER